MAWYPRRAAYYVAVAADAATEQGDVFWAVPLLRATHPEIAVRFLPPGDPPPAEDVEPPARSAVLHGVDILADAAIVVPHTCDFHGPEKGRTHRDRLVARVQAIRPSGIADPELLRSGDGYQHTFFLPSWEHPTDNG